MHNELITSKSWWQKNWRWFLPLLGIVLLLLGVVMTSKIGKIGSDMVQGYSEIELYENALKKVKSDATVTYVLGEIEPIDKFAILEGQISYRNNDQTVHTTIRIKGSKGNAKLDIVADRAAKQWVYKTLNVRVIHPLENKQTIELIQEQK